jgi:hypothetical protein
MLLGKLPLINKGVIKLVHRTFVHLFPFLDHLSKVGSDGILGLLNVLIVDGKRTIFVLILAVVLSPLRVVVGADTLTLAV